MSKVSKKLKNSAKSDYILKIGVFLFFLGLIVMMFATYISFVKSENVQFEYQKLEVL